MELASTGGFGAWLSRDVALTLMAPLGMPEIRDTTIGELSERFANDEIGMEEFERRVTLAHRADSVDELRALLEDLPGGASRLQPLASPEAISARGRVELRAVSEVHEKQAVTAILGGVQRAGSWTVPRLLEVVTVLGGAQLDFRDARFGPGVSTVNVFAMMGGVEIIVPPDLAVEVQGGAILGGFEHLERTPSRVDPDRAQLRVTGMAVLGGVTVHTRPVGDPRALPRLGARR